MFYQHKAQKVFFCCWSDTKKITREPAGIMLMITWHHDTEALSASQLQDLCKEIHQWFPSQRASTTEFWCFPCCHPKQDFAQTNKVQVVSFRWCHNGCDGVSNHQPHHCLLNRYSGTDQRKHQSSASLAFVRGIHRDRWIPRTKGQ